MQNADSNAAQQAGIPASHNPEINPWVPMDRPIDVKHVGKALEELGELAEVIGRCTKALARALIQGIDERDPTTGQTNKWALEQEMADAQANFELVTVHFRLDRATMERRQQRKIAGLRKWHQMLP
jgi:hypothetical protein